MITVFLYTMIGSWEEAAELCQETFVVAFKKFGEYDDSRASGAWLRGIARNLARNALRKRASYRRLLARQREFESIFSIWTAGEDEEQFALVSKALSNCLRKLTPRQRQVVKLSYEEGQSAREIAAQLSVKEGTVNQLLWQARSALRVCLASRKPGGKR